MSITDYVIDIGLIALVILQVRGRRLSLKSLVIPLVLVVWAASKYLHGIPTAGNDLALIGTGLGAGVLLGVGCGLFTRLSVASNGVVVAKASIVAAVLWVLGVGTRLAFQLYATHGGSPSIARFSAHHAITSSEAWVACLILMAFGEVVARLLVITLRARPLGFLSNPVGPNGPGGPLGGRRNLRARENFS